MIATTILLLLGTGAQQLVQHPEIEPTWINQFGKGDSYLALVYGSLAGLLTAMLLVWAQRMMTWRQLRAASFDGARTVLHALAILWLAWALSAMTGRIETEADGAAGQPGRAEVQGAVLVDGRHLGTGDYLASILARTVAVVWMPTIVFVLSSLVAFSTGTSWGTMGILMPLVVSVTYNMLATGGAAVGPSDPLLLASIGSVLAGAIFGDHCSPISDTTVLSSQASGCDHIRHVRTQLPYALLVGIVTIICGTLPAGFGVSPYLLLPIGPVILLGCLMLLGHRVPKGA
jgi:Na+/H+ antiporter NhaC